MSNYVFNQALSCPRSCLIPNPGCDLRCNSASIIEDDLCTSGIRNVDGQCTKFDGHWKDINFEVRDYQMVLSTDNRFIRSIPEGGIVDQIDSKIKTVGRLY